MMKFIELTYSFNGERVSIRKDLVLSFTPFILEEDKHPKYYEMYGKAKARITIDQQTTTTDFLSKERYTLNTRSIEVIETYDEIKKLMGEK